MVPVFRYASPHRRTTSMTSDGSVSRGIILLKDGDRAAARFAAEMADECRRLLEGLGDATLRAVALGKMRGDTNAEIAARLGCVEQTVERKLRRIRGLWGQEVE